MSLEIKDSATGAGVNANHELKIATSEHASDAGFA
jgi:hypothetical protein